MRGRSAPTNSRELARLLGVSQSTISRALNDSPRVPEEVRKRIRGKAAEVGFELNSQAQSLRTRRTGTIGLLFPHHFHSMNENLMLAHIYDHIQRDLIASDYDVMLVYDYAGSASGSVLERMIRRRKLDGLILLRKTLTDSEFRLIRARSFPCIYMLNSETAHQQISRAISDSEYGGYLAGCFLGQFRDYKLLFVRVREDPEKSDWQQQGIERGLATHRRKLAASWIKECNLSMESGYDFVMKNRALFVRHKIALVPHTDILASAMLCALADLGIPVPEQVQVLGQDGIPLANWMRPRLSGLRVPVREMVAEGCRQIRDLIEHGGGEVHVAKFKPTLELRDTTLPGAAPL